MTHSILSPSSAHIWGKPDGCTGYVTMSQLYKNTGSYAANEGKAAHELCEIMLRDPYFKFSKNKFSSNGILFDDEMYQSAKVYTEDIVSMLTVTKSDMDSLKIEKKVECKSINYLSFGTVDAYFYNPDEDMLYLWDYKYGHITVEPFENWQLINYASGLVDKLSLNSHTYVNFRIVQPRSYSAGGIVRDWTITVEELQPFFEQLRNAANEAIGTNAVLKSGTHCKYCPARHACKPAMDAGLNLYEASSKVQPSELSNNEIGLQLSIVKRALKHLECIESALEQQIKHSISSGKNISGWVIKHKKGRKEWNVPISKIHNIGKDNNLNLLKPQEAITPTQAIKLGLNEKIVDKYSSRKNQGFKLIEDDPKESIKIFGVEKND